MTSDVIIVTGGRILFVIRKLLEDAGPSTYTITGLYRDF